MTLSLSAALALASQCAPGVAPETLLSIAHTESGLNPLAIGVNGGSTPPPMRTQASAAFAARRYIAAGYSVDLGIAQINSANLARLGLSIDDAFDPCRNLAAAAKILSENYMSAARRYAGDAALGVALSLYNTGTERRGYRNGYVARVYRSAAVLVPAISDASQVHDMARDLPVPQDERFDREPDRTRSTLDPTAAIPPALATRAQPAAWDVFATTRTSSAMVFKGVEQ